MTCHICLGNCSLVLTAFGASRRHKGHTFKTYGPGEKIPIFGIKLVRENGADRKPLGFVRISSPPKLASRRVNSQMPEIEEVSQGDVKQKKKPKKVRFPKAKKATARKRGRRLTIDSEDESSADEGPKLVDSISTGDLKRKPKVNGILKKPSKKATDEVKKSPKSPSNGKGFNLLNRLDDIGNIPKKTGIPRPKFSPSLGYGDVDEEDSKDDATTNSDSDPEVEILQNKKVEKTGKKSVVPGGTADAGVHSVHAPAAAAAIGKNSSKLPEKFNLVSSSSSEDDEDVQDHDDGGEAADDKDSDAVAAARN
eukprot:SAG11_NODE_6110_length_1386_cov_16.605284_1_plen_308_part_10